MPFKYQLEEIDPKKIIIKLDGRLDSASSPLLDSEIGKLVDKGYIRVLLDLSSVDFLTSAGMRVLHSATKKLKSKHGHFIIYSLQEEPEKVIRMAGFDK